ncbi:MAG: hypothetical protein ACK5B3_04650 [Bacteroidota bacterium]|jgi:hypothetical protein
MHFKEIVTSYIESLSSEKRDDMMILHRLILSIKPDFRLFFDGKNYEF